MFVLDTNVLSALMHPQPPASVLEWVAGQPIEQLYTASVCAAEILGGIAVLPEGRRRDGLALAAQAMFDEDFAGRVLPFDQDAAAAYAEIYAQRRAAGRPIATMDLIVAATARAHGASVVSRDTSGFVGCGIPLINPWAAP